MKRMLVLTSLSLTAMMLVTSQANAQLPLRAATQQVTSSVTPARDQTRPYTFTTTGRVVPPPFCAAGVIPVASGPCFGLPITCPPGSTNPAYCQSPAICPPGTAQTPYCVNIPPTVLCRGGQVAIKFQRIAGKFTISNRVATLRDDCTYRSQVSFRTRNPLRRGRLHVNARFLGNVFLQPRSATKKIVRAG